MKRIALLLALAVVVLVPALVRAQQALRERQRAPAGDPVIHVELHRRDTGTVATCDGSVRMEAGRAASVSFARASADPARCMEAVRASGALADAKPGDVVYVSADPVR